MKIFEYMSYKKPIISSNFKVLREVLDTKNSILVDSDNIDEWCKAIDTLKDKKIQSRMGEAAYSDFINFYTWDIRVKLVIDIYRSYCNK